MSEPVADIEPTTDPAAPAQEPVETDWKAEARKWEARAKENKAKLDEAAPIVSQWKQLEEASKTELERKTEELNRWQSEAERWRTTSVSSRVEALAAAAEFADSSDAVTALKDKLASYLDAGGAIDDEAIRADLADVLERKPHWRRSQGNTNPPAPRVPAPNPSQGSGVNGTAAANPAAEFASIIQGQLSRS